MRLTCCPALAGAVFATALGAQAPLKVPAIAVERYTLPNGLTVLLSENHSSPVVAVDVWYHVGSKNDHPKAGGVAHLFEHLMFQGSEHIPFGKHYRMIEAAGSEPTATTTADRTGYSELLPSNYLETALWLESDRMGFLLPALDQAKLDGQREIVGNEHRRLVENPPYGWAESVLREALFPADHPYSLPVMGAMSQLAQVSLKDAKDFFHTYYVPGNATLAVVGDFDPVRAKALIEKYFGPIPGGAAVTQPAAAPVTLPAEKRIVLEDNKATIPRLTIAWPTVGVGQPDDLPLHLLANLLAGDRASRLTKLLVYDRQLATDVTVAQQSHENAGWFQISVIPRSTASLTDIEQIIDSTLTTLTTSQPPEQEVTRAKGYARIDTTLALEHVLNRAETLLDGEVFHHDPSAYLQRTEGELALTAGDVARVAKQYLTAGRVVLSMVPAGKLGAVAKPQVAYTNMTPKQAPPTAAPPTARPSAPARPAGKASGRPAHKPHQ